MQGCEPRRAPSMSRRVGRGEGAGAPLTLTALRCAGAVLLGERCQNRSGPSRILGNLDLGVTHPCSRLPLQVRRFPRGKPASSPERSARPGARGSSARRIRPSEGSEESL